MNELAFPAARCRSPGSAGAGAIAVSAAVSRGPDFARGGCANIHGATGRPHCAETSIGTVGTAAANAATGINEQISKAPLGALTLIVLIHPSS